MQLKRYQSAEQFLEANLCHLLRDEAMNSLLLGLAIGNKGKENDQSLYLDIRDKERVYLAAIKTRGRHLIVSADHDKFALYATVFCDYILENGIRLPGLIGPKQLVLDFQEAFQRWLGWDFTIQFRQLVYRLDQVSGVTNIHGDLRLVERAESALVSEWLHAFYREVFGVDDQEEAYRLVRDKIEKKEAYIWLDQSIVTMACTARPTPNGVTINYVYTPTEYRRHGYASMIVAVISQLQLEKGYKFCTLFADMDNPTSNRIYQKIGYQVVGEFRSIDFRGKKAEDTLS